jgi:hypothetical protein
MSKKKIEISEEEFEENEDPNIESTEESNESSDSEENESDDFISDEDEIDIIIEISDDDLDLSLDIKDVEKEIDTSESIDDIILSKHQMEGKHSLKYDSIFKGKKEEKISEDDNTLGYFNEKFEVDKSSFFYTESFENEQYNRSKGLKEKVYIVLAEHTNINFLNNRRKPSKIDFNNYYYLLVQNLSQEKFTNVELFNELSVYFSDNLFNMFKLLDNKWRNMIINELQDHIGKNKNSKEIKNRNIYVGTEVEFTHEDNLGEVKLYTGVITETIYEESTFIIDSYENLYEVDIINITKILNNSKFKYNLNKLNNIDFL